MDQSSLSLDNTSERLRASLVRLLADFEAELRSGNLRTKVRALIPIREALDSLGVSLIPSEIASSARDRILVYLRAYPFTVIPREELQVVAGISEWARRVRELRVEYGWRIYSGTTVSEMIAEDSSLTDELGFDHMPADSYILLDETQDIEAAYRWHVAHDIRNTTLGVRDKILTHLRANVGKPITGEELRYVARDKTEWARRTRELRTEFGWPIATKQSGRPDLPTGVYVLEEDRQSPEHDRRIPDPIRGKVLRRDDYHCRRCGWHHALNNPSDPRHLELHHIVHHAVGGENTEENLITLCTRCHDEWHRIADSANFDVWLRDR